MTDQDIQQLIADQQTAIEISSNVKTELEDMQYEPRDRMEEVKYDS